MYRIHPILKKKTENDLKNTRPLDGVIKRVIQIIFTFFTSKYPKSTSKPIIVSFYIFEFVIAKPTLRIKQYGRWLISQDVTKLEFQIHFKSLYGEHNMKHLCNSLHSKIQLESRSLSKMFLKGLLFGK